MELEEDIDFDKNLFGKVENLDLYNAINTFNKFEFDKESNAPQITIYKQFAETFIDQNNEREFQYYSFYDNQECKITQVLQIINPKLIDSQNVRSISRYNLKIIHVHLSTKKMNQLNQHGINLIKINQAKEAFQYMVQQIMLNYIIEIEHKQSEQVVHSALILIQGEWLQFNSFLYAVACYNLVISQTDEVEKPKKIVFINLTGHDTESNHQFWNDTNNQLKSSKAIYISFVLNNEFLEENKPAQRKYIIPLRKNTSTAEIEYIFEEFLFEIIEGAYTIFLQLGVNSDLQLNQSVVQNIVNRLNQISNQKLIIQIQYIKYQCVELHKREKSVELGAKHFLELYQAVLEGVQGPSKYQNLPSLFNFSSNYWENLKYICDSLRNTKQKKLVKIISNLLIEHENIKKFQIGKTIQQDKLVDQYFISNIFIQNQIIQFKIKIDFEQFQVVQDTKEYINYESYIVFYQNLKIYQNKKWKFIDAFAKIEQINANHSIFLKQLEWREKSHTSIFIKNKLIYRNYGYIKNEDTNQENEFTDVIDVYDTQNNTYYQIRRNGWFNSDLTFIDKIGIEEIIKKRIGGTCIEFGNGYFIIGGSPFENTKAMNIIEIIQIQNDGFTSAKIRKDHTNLYNFYCFYPFEQNLVLKKQNQYLILGSNNYSSQTPYLNFDDRKSHEMALLLSFDAKQQITFINLKVNNQSKEFKEFFSHQEKSENWIYLEDEDCWLIIQKKYIKNKSPIVNLNELEIAAQQFISKKYCLDEEGKLVLINDRLDNIDILKDENLNETSKKYHFYEEYLVLSKIYVSETKKTVVINSQIFTQSDKQYEIYLDNIA